MNIKLLLLSLFQCITIYFTGTSIVYQQNITGYGNGVAKSSTFLNLICLGCSNISAVNFSSYYLNANSILK